MAKVISLHHQGMMLTAERKSEKEVLQQTVQALMELRNDMVMRCNEILSQVSSNSSEVNNLVKRVERMESICQDELCSISSHLQLKQDQIVTKQDLIQGTVPSVISPVWSPPCGSASLLRTTTPAPDVIDNIKVFPQQLNVMDSELSSLIESLTGSDVVREEVQQIDLTNTLGSMNSNVTGGQPIIHSVFTQDPRSSGVGQPPRPNSLLGLDLFKREPGVGQPPRPNSLLGLDLFNPLTGAGDYIRHEGVLVFKNSL